MLVTRDQSIFIISFFFRFKLCVMASEDRMPKIEKPVIDPSTQEWMKVIEKLNADRVQKLKRVRAKNKICGALLGAAAVGIYTYSIVTVKQETFLDDFDEPKLVPKESPYTRPL